MIRVIYFIFLAIGILRAECFYDGNNPKQLNYFNEEQLVDDCYYTSDGVTDGKEINRVYSVDDILNSDLVLPEIFKSDLRFERYKNLIGDNIDNLFISEDYKYIKEDPKITLTLDTDNLFVSYYDMEGSYYNSLGYYAYNETNNSQSNINSSEPNNQLDLIDKGIILFPSITESEDTDSDNKIQNRGIIIDLGFFPKDTKLIFFLISDSFKSGSYNEIYLDNNGNSGGASLALYSDLSNNNGKIFTTTSTFNMKIDLEDKDNCTALSLPSCDKHVSMLWKNRDGSMGDTNEGFNIDRYVIMGFEDLTRSISTELPPRHDFDDTIFAIATNPVDSLSINMPILEIKNLDGEESIASRINEDSQYIFDIESFHFIESDRSVTDTDGDTFGDFKELRLVSLPNECGVLKKNGITLNIDDLISYNDIDSDNFVFESKEDFNGVCSFKFDGYSANIEKDTGVYSNEVLFNIDVLAINDSPTIKTEAYVNPDISPININLIDDLEFNPNDREDENDALNGFTINSIKSCDGVTTYENSDYISSETIQSFTLKDNSISDGDCLIFNITAYDKCINYDDVDNISKGDGHCSEALDNSESVQQDIKIYFTGYPTVEYNEDGTLSSGDSTLVNECSGVSFDGDKLVNINSIAIDDKTTHKNIEYISGSDFECENDVKVKILDINNAPAILSDTTNISLKGDTSYVVDITKSDNTITFSDSIDTTQSIDATYSDSEGDEYDISSIDILKDSPTDIVISYGSLDDIEGMTQCTTASEICTSLSSQLLNIFDTYLDSEDKSKLDFSTLDIDEDIKVDFQVRVYDIPVCDSGFECDTTPKLSNNLPIKLLIEAKETPVYSIEVNEGISDSIFNIKDSSGVDINIEFFECDSFSDITLSSSTPFDFNIDNTNKVYSISTFYDMLSHNSQIGNIIEDSNCKLNDKPAIINITINDVNNSPTLGDSAIEYSNDNPFKYSITELAPSSNYLVDINYKDSESDLTLENSLDISDLTISVQVGDEYQECTLELGNSTCNNLSSSLFQESSITINEDNKLQFSLPDITNNLKIVFNAKVKDNPTVGDTTSKDSNILPVEVLISANDLGENIITILENSTDELNISSYSDSLTTTTCSNFNDTLESLTVTNNYSIVDNSIKVFNDIINHKNYEYSLSGCTTSSAESIDVILIIKDVNIAPTIDNDSDAENELTILDLGEISENITSEEILKSYTINSFIDKLNYSDSESDQLKSFEVVSIDKIVYGETTVCDENCEDNIYIDKTKFALNSENINNLDFTLPDIDDNLTINFKALVYDNPLCIDTTSSCDLISKESNSLDLQLTIISDKPSYIKYPENSTIDACSVVLNFDKTIDSLVDISKVEFTSGTSTIKAEEFTLDGTKIIITKFDSSTGCLSGSTTYSVTSSKDNFGPTLLEDVDDILTTKSLDKPTASNKTIYIYENDDNTSYSIVLSGDDGISGFNDTLSFNIDSLTDTTLGSNSCTSSDCTYTPTEYKDNSFTYEVCRASDGICSYKATVSIIRGIHFTGESVYTNQDPCSKIEVPLEFDKSVNLFTALDYTDSEKNMKVETTKDTNGDVTLYLSAISGCLDYSAIYSITVPKDNIAYNEEDKLQKDVIINIETVPKNPELVLVDFIATEDGEKEFIAPDVINNSLTTIDPLVEIASAVELGIDVGFILDEESCSFKLNDTVDIPSEKVELIGDKIKIFPYNGSLDEWIENSTIKLSLDKSCIVSSDDETKSLLSDIEVTFNTAKRRTPPELDYVKYIDSQIIDVKKDNTSFETANNVPLSTYIIFGFSVPITLKDSYGDNGYIEVYKSDGTLFQKTYLNDIGLISATANNEIKLKLLKDLEPNSSYYVLIKSDTNIDKSYCIDSILSYSEAENSEVAIYDASDSNGCQIFEGVYNSSRIKFNTNSELCLIKDEDNTPLIEYRNSKIYIYYNRAIIRGNDSDNKITLYNSELNTTKTISVYDSIVSIDRNILIIDVSNFDSKDGYSVTIEEYIVQDSNKVFAKGECAKANYNLLISDSESNIGVVFDLEETINTSISDILDDEVNPYLDDETLTTKVTSKIDGECTYKENSEIYTVVNGECPYSSYNTQDIVAKTNSSEELEVDCENNFFTNIKLKGSNTKIDGDIEVKSIVDKFESTLNNCESLESVQDSVYIYEDDLFIDILDGSSKFERDSTINKNATQSQFATNIPNSTLTIDDDKTMKLEANSGKVIAKSNTNRRVITYFKDGTNIVYTLRDDISTFEDGAEVIIKENDTECEKCSSGNVIKIRTKVTEPLQF
jgi:hypothetical protein